VRQDLTNIFLTITIMFLKATATILNGETKVREFKTILVEMEDSTEETTTEEHQAKYFETARKANSILTNNGQHIMTGWGNEIVNAELGEEEGKLIVDTKQFSPDGQTDIEIITL